MQTVVCPSTKGVSMLLWRRKRFVSWLWITLWKARWHVSTVLRRKKRFVSWSWTTLWKAKWPMSPCYCQEGKGLSTDHGLLCEKWSDLCLHCVVKKEKVCQLIMDYFVKSEVTYVSTVLWRKKRFVSWSWTALWKARWPMSPLCCEEGKDKSADHGLLCEKRSDLPMLCFGGRFVSWLQTALWRGVGTRVKMP